VDRSVPVPAWRDLQFRARRLAAVPMTVNFPPVPTAKLLHPTDLITNKVTTSNNYIDSNSKFVTIIKIIPWQIEKSSNRMIPAGTSTRKRAERNM
jgi:hypothetical protein